MSRRARHVAAAAAVALPALLAVGACSGSDDSPSAGSTVASAGSDGTVVGGATRGSGTDATTAGAAVARAAMVADGGIVSRVVADGDLVAVHAELPADPAAGTPGQAVVEISRVQDGTITERWRVSQDVVQPAPGRWSMFDGAGDPTAEADTAANKAVVTRLYDEVFNGGRVEVADELIDPAYLQHNPSLPDGIEAFKGLVANGLPVTVDALIAQGDLVVAKVTYGAPGGDGVPAVDIFRLADGRIVEHWDVLHTSGTDPNLPTD